MAPWINITVAVSLVVSLILLVTRAVKTKKLRLLICGFLAAVGFAAFLRILFGFPSASDFVPKSSSSDPAIAAALFFSMILGMLAQFLFSRFILPQEQRKAFDWGVFIAPLFASPLIFLPLLGALQNADLDLTHLTVPRMMVLLVAFQNGFFWKDFLDRQRRDVESK